MNYLFIIENGRLTLQRGREKEVRYIPWDVIKLGKIEDFHQFYYHTRLLFEKVNSLTEVTICMFMDQMVTYQYPKEKLSKKEEFSLESMQEEKLGIEEGTYIKIRKQDPKGHQCLSYYPRETVDKLKKCFSDLKIKVDFLAHPFIEKSSLYTSADFIFFQNVNSLATKLVFNHEWVDFLKKERISSKEGYRLMSGRLSSEEEEVNWHFMIYFMEGVSEFKAHLKQVHSLKINEETRGDSLKKFTSSPIETLDLNWIQDQEHKEKKLGIPIGKKVNKFYAALLGLVLLTFIGIFVHYTSLKREYTAELKNLQIKAKKEVKATREKDIGPLLQFEDKRLKDFNLTVNGDIVLLQAKSTSLDYIHYIKEKVQKTNYQLKDQEIYYEDGLYCCQFKLE